MKNIYQRQHVYHSPEKYCGGPHGGPGSGSAAWAAAQASPGAPARARRPATSARAADPGSWSRAEVGGRASRSMGLRVVSHPPPLSNPDLGDKGNKYAPPPRALGLDKGGDKDKIGFPGCGGVHTRRSLSVDPRSSWQSPNVVNNIIIRKSVQPDGFLG